MYARDKIEPKLHQLDEEKLSRLFSELRRESQATGSFPITVRHLESMIRMAEASAKMHLREYVRADDVDVAIAVTVGSFVSAQKMSIKKTLERVRAWLPRIRYAISHRHFLGVPEILVSCPRSRRTTGIFAWTDCQRQSKDASTAEARATRICGNRCRRAQDTGGLLEYSPCVRAADYNRLGRQRNMAALT